MRLTYRYSAELFSLRHRYYICLTKDLVQAMQLAAYLHPVFCFRHSSASQHQQHQQQVLSVVQCRAIRASSSSPVLLTHKNRGLSVCLSLGLSVIRHTHRRRMTRVIEARTSDPRLVGRKLKVKPGKVANGSDAVLVWRGVCTDNSLSYNFCVLLYYQLLLKNFIHRIIVAR